MTELEFKLRDPNTYGAGNLNLLYSSSVDRGDLPLSISQIPQSILDEYASTATPVPDPSIPSSSADGGIYDNVTRNPKYNPETDTYEYFYELENAFFPPYSVIGVTISYNSLNSVKLEDTIKQIKFLTFSIGSDRIKVKVLAISKLTGYYYLQVEPTVFTSMPGSTDSSGVPIDFNVEVNFIDYLSGNFTNSEFDVLLGNALRLKTSKGAIQVDRNTDAASPSNLSAIITETASPAEVQYSNYTTSGWTNARYEGSLNTPIQERDLPAQSYVMFEGAIHPVDANTVTLQALGAGDPDKSKLYFNVESRPTDFIPSGSNLLIDSTFPIVKGTPIAKGTAFEADLIEVDTSVIYSGTTALYAGSVIYREEGNKLVRVVSSKIHAIDKGSVYTTDEFGIAVNEVTASSDA